MDESGFAGFLKRDGRSSSAIKRCLAHTQEFEKYLATRAKTENLDKASPDDMHKFVAWIEADPKTSAKAHLWALRYYYRFAGDEAMSNLAGALREERIKRTPFALAKFRGVNPELTDKLATVGIRNIEQMLRAGQTPASREALSARTDIPLDAIVELVKLSDLAHIPGMKGIRARLYHDAGVDTLEKLAAWDQNELGEMLNKFVQETGFDGIAPLPKEVAFSVTRAQSLPKIVEYE